MSTTWTPIVSNIRDGQTVTAATVNPVIGQLVKRDQYLYEQFTSMQDKSVITAFGLAADSSVSVGDIVFFDSTAGLLKKAKIGFTNTDNNLAPINDSFVLGIVKAIDTSSLTRKADVYIKGLIELPGLLASLDVTTTQTGAPVTSALTTGPIYLSKIYSGKASNNPGGLCVYIGYALSADQILLDPRNEAINQIFFNYKFDIIDRPIGTPVIDGNGNYAVANADIGKVGWVDINNSILPTSISSTFPKSVIPTTAVYYYWLPQSILINSDTTLTTEDKNAALSLINTFPPYPYSFTYLTVNGVSQAAWTTTNKTGKFYVNSAGLWWIGGTPGEQPWANDLNDTWTPTQWSTVKGTDYLRPRINIQFVKMNPDYQLSTVTSLSSNTPCLAVKSASTSSASKLSGDLALQLNLSTATSPYRDTANTFVRKIAVDTTSGAITAYTSTGVSQISAGAGISVTSNSNDTSQVVISATSTGISGVVDDIEPENARLENIGLHWYVNLVDPTIMSSGFVGKFLIPRNSPQNDIKLYLNLFTQDSNANGNSASFNFEYAVSAPGVVVTDNTTVIPVSIDFTPTYTLGQLVISSPFTIPGSVLNGVTDDAYVNFRITRVSSTFNGNIGVIGVSWKIS